MTSSLVPDINICQGNVTGFFLNHVIDDRNTDPCLLLAMTGENQLCTLPLTKLQDFAVSRVCYDWAKQAIHVAYEITNQWNEKNTAVKHVS